MREGRVREVMDVPVDQEMPDSRMSNGEVVGKKLVLQQELFARLLKEIVGRAPKGTLLETINGHVEPGIMVDMKVVQEAAAAVGGEIDTERREKRRRIVAARRRAAAATVGEKRPRDDDDEEEKGTTRAKS